jgi:hypothetical protein
MNNENDIITIEAKHLVGAVLGLDLRAFSRTNDHAWLSFAAKILKAQA